jgi:hypothetical protein
MGSVAIPLSFVNPRSGRSWNSVRGAHYALYYNCSRSSRLDRAGKDSRVARLWPVHARCSLILAFLFYRQLYGFRWLPARADRSRHDCQPV